MAGELDPIALNVAGVSDLVRNPTNKIKGGFSGTDEGATGEPLDALELDMSDEELLKLSRRWENRYAPYEAKIKPIQEKNKIYYLGKQMLGTPSVAENPIASNLLFEAEETFLPAALSKNPQPVVYADNTEEGNKIANDIKTMLQYHADVLVFRRKLATVVRQWSIYHLGVLKYGWNADIQDVTIQVRKIQDFIFDPTCAVDEYGDFTSYLGERITVTAEKLIDMFPDHEEYILEITEGKTGTDVTYTEWWTDEYCFITFKNKILDKHKNEFFKYPTKELDEFGGETEVKAQNHFAKAKKPYTFLSVFTLGDQPHDVTGLIEQNIPNQNLVTKRTNQIDYNLTRQNNSDAFSENNFTQETAKQAANAFLKGNPVLVPQGGPIKEAIVRFPAEGFTDSAFRELEMNKESLRSIFGTQGISAQPPKEDTTARGMILNQQYDNTRIGGGIGDAVAQVADSGFNWLVQLYYVFYDEPHFAAVMGQLKAVEYTVLRAANLNKQVIVSVAADSMKPKDEITEINQAIKFYQMGAIGPKTLLTIANFPNVDESAADGVLWKVAPQEYLQLNWPELAQQIQAMQQQQMALQQQQQQMEMQGQQQAGEQQLGQKQAAHEQGLRHKEESHKQKLSLQKEGAPTTGGVTASPSLNRVPLPGNTL